MLEFSTRGDFGTRSLDAYAAIFSNQNLIDGVTTSLQIAVLTVAGMLVLLVPTMVWTVVRVPRMRRVVEFLCLLPLAIPAIVIVVGIAPIYRWMGQHLGAVGASPLTLALIDIILVLPFAYRAIDASLRSIDSPTLADAARSLGAGWPRTISRSSCRTSGAGSCRRRCWRSRWSSASTRSRRCWLQHPAGRDLPARQAQPVHLGRGVARCPALRVRPADRHHPLRAGGDRRASESRGTGPMTDPSPTRRHDRTRRRGRVPGHAPLVRLGPCAERAVHRHRPGRVDRAARSVGLRQDHCAARARRARRRRPGHDPGRRQGHHQRVRPTSETWASCSRPTACSRT